MKVYRILVVSIGVALVLNGCGEDNSGDAEDTRRTLESYIDAYNDGDYKTAMTNWQAVVKSTPGTVPPAGYAESHYAIGMLYWKGQGVNMDYSAASTWLYNAAELGHAGAQGKLGYLYTEGIAIQQNHYIAFEWFSKAAKQGDVDGLYNLGIFYMNGWGTEKNKTMAAQYLAAASTQGDKNAETVLQELLKNMQYPEEIEPPTQPAIYPSEWILAQDPNHYTIQVIGLSTIHGLETLIQDYPDLSPFAIYTLERNGQPLHLLIQGVYTDVESARKAKSTFPKSIQKPKNVWIRKFEKIQELIKANH